jgi:F420-non-reducing hydrogenase iron-sulfur subunit
MTTTADSFEPRIVGFLCNWCSYAGADAAGTSRLKYAPNIRIIRVMCSGRVAPEHVIRTFREAPTG